MESNPGFTVFKADALISRPLLKLAEIVVVLVDIMVVALVVVVLMVVVVVVVSIIIRPNV